MNVGMTNKMFGTRPIAVHCPSPLHDDWRRFVGTVMDQGQRRCQAPDVTVFTWNGTDRPTKPCGVLERSLERLGIPTLVLGQGPGAPWKNIDKFRLTFEALQRVKTPYVIGADSCDVIFFDNPQLAVDRFRTEFHCELVFNATGSRCWPELPEFVRFESALPMAKVAQQRHWLNSGLFIGKTEFCREYFRQLAQEPPIAGYEFSDQAVIKQTWPRWFPQVQLDYFSSIFQWFNEDRQVMVAERPIAPRQTSLLRWFRRFSGPITGAEVGVFDGCTSEVLLRELPELRLWLVDPWKPYEGKSVLGDMTAEQLEKARIRAMWWTEFARDRRFVLREASPRPASRFADASLDFAFIDGNHLYEAVRDDIAAWWPKIRPGGLLTGHDYGIYRDAEGLWGVRRAVDEFADHHRRQIELGLDGTWCIEK